MSSQPVGENNRNGRNSKAKTVTFYKSGDVNFAGLRMAITQRNYRSFETLLDELTKKVALPQGARRVHTPGGIHSVTSVEALEDGKSYVVTSSRKLKPLNLDEIQKQRVWIPAKKTLPNGTASKKVPNGQKKPVKAKTSPKERTPPSRDARSTKLPPTPKKIMIMKNGDLQTKHMMLLNRRTAQNFEDVLQDISEIFKLPVKKLCTSDGTKVESLQAVFNGPELFVALSGTERFRPLNYLENSPFKAVRSRERLRRKSEDSGDQPPAKITKKSKGKWRVWIATNENPAAGTDATVYMVVYGDKGKTDDIILGAGDGYFEAGNEDEFTIQIGDVGEIYKIRIGHDDGTEFAGWKCDEVRMQDVHTGEELIFICDRWMSRDEDDSDVCRELAVSRDEQPLAVIKYQVLVTTGNYWGAGLDGKVYITLIGERGDSGPRLLYKSNRANPFEKGRTDIFHLEAIDLNKLKGILIGHDSDEADKGWYLDKVVVKETEGEKRDFLFPCYQWLDVAKDDGAITREISVSTTPVNFESDMWDQEKWKFETGNHIMLVHKASGKALHVTGDGSIEAGTDPYTKMSSAFFVVEHLKNSVCVFSSLSNNKQILAVDGNKISVQPKNGPLCEFKVRIQVDSTVALESCKSAGQLMTFNAVGKPVDSKGSLGPTKVFFCYVKGMFRDEGIILLYTSRTQTLMLEDSGECLATGSRSEHAFWKVHKVKEGGIRMFENLSMPHSFLQIKNGGCNARGDGDECCHFKVLKMKDKGFVKLQSVAEPDLFVGFNLDGTVHPLPDDGNTFLSIFPAIEQVGVTKKRQTPTPPTTPKPANRKKRAPLKKRKSTEQIQKQSLPPKVAKKDGKEKQGGKNTKTNAKDFQNKKKTDPKVRVKKVSVVPEKPTKESSTEDEIAVSHPEPLGEETSFYEEGDWKVWVKTGTSGTKSSVVLVVYGENKTSEPVKLGKGGELFTSGAENDFKVNLSDFGDIYKIRVGLDTISRKAAWRLDQVKMKDMNSGQQLTFKFKNRWLAMREDDGSVWREAAAVRPGTKPLPINKYSVQVTTGWEAGSGTDANVFLTLVGEKGDTGKRLLHKTADKELFQEGQTNMFELEAVSVQKLKSIVVEHDGTGAGAGWFCKEILVKESKDSKSEYIFRCDRWLDEGQDDKLIKRELVLTEKRKIKENDWHVYVTTGDDEKASLAGPVTLFVYGEKEHKEVTLNPVHEKGFSASSIEDFRINVGDIGKFSKVRIGHKNPSKENSWHLKSLQLVDKNSSTVHNFEANRWLSPEEDDLDVWREFPIAQEGKKPANVIKYYIQVFTGSEADSDTKATVSLNIFGKNTDSGSRQLMKSKNNKKMFANGQMDVFEIEAVALGKLQKVVVGHDGEEKGQGWYLEKIVIKESKNAKNEFFFPCKRWLDVGQDDGKIERELFVGKAPAAPTCVTSVAAKATVDTLTVTWQPPAAVTGYRVTLDPPDATTSEIKSSDSKLTEVLFEKLTPGREYQVNIISINGDLESENVSLKATTVPSKVGNLKVDATKDTMKVSWEKPEGNVTCFKVKIHPSDAKKPTVKTKDGETTKVQFTGLTPGKEYKIEVISISGEKESEKVTVSETTGAAEVVPAPVTDQALKGKVNSLTATWTKPSGDITGYLVVLTPLGKDPQEMKIDNPDETSAEFKNLDAGLKCTVDIIPLAGETKGEKVTIKGRTELAKVPKVKSAKADSTSTAIKVTWGKPRGDITGYRLTCIPKEGSESDTKEIKLDGPRNYEATFDGLDSDTEFVIEIFTVHEERESYRVYLAAKTEPVPIQTVTGLSPGEITEDTVIVTWSPIEDSVTGYLVTASLKSKPEETIKEMKIDSTENPEAKLEGLEEDSDYVIGVKVVDGERIGESVTLSVKTKPKVLPEVVNLSNEVTEHSITLKWEKPEGGVKGYVVSYKDLATDSEGKELIVEDAEQTEVKVDGLEPSVDYMVLICVNYGDKKSEGVSLTIQTKSIQSLNPVTDLTAEATHNSIGLTWVKPEGSPFTGYKVKYRVKGHKEDAEKKEEEEKEVKEEEEEEEKEKKEEEKEEKEDEEKEEEKEKEENEAEENEKEKEKEVKEKDEEEKKEEEKEQEKEKDEEKDEEKKEEKEQDESEIALDDAEATSASVTKLKPGTVYVVNVYTMDGERCSEATSIEVKTATPPLEVKPVSDLKAKPSQNSVVLTWVKPEDCPMSGYRIEYRQKKDEDSKKELFVNDVEETSATLAELESETEYFIDIYTLNGESQSEKAATEAKTESVKVDRVHKAYVKCKDTSITASWKKPEGIITGYQLTCTPADEKDGPEVKELSLDDPEVTKAVFEGLVPDTEYLVKIYAKNGKKKSDKVKLKGKTKKSIVAGIQPVDNLKVSPSLNKIKVTWSKPSSSSSSVTGYKIVYYKQSSGENQEALEKDDKETAENNKLQAAAESQNKEQSESKKDEEEAEESRTRDGKDETREKGNEKSETLGTVGKKSQSKEDEAGGTKKDEENVERATEEDTGPEKEEGNLNEIDKEKEKIEEEDGEGKQEGETEPKIGTVEGENFEKNKEGDISSENEDSKSKTIKEDGSEEKDIEDNQIDKIVNKEDQKEDNGQGSEGENKTSGDENEKRPVKSGNDREEKEDVAESAKNGVDRENLEEKETGKGKNDGPSDKTVQRAEKMELLISEPDTCSAILKDLEKEVTYHIEVFALYGQEASQSSVILATTAEDEAAALLKPVTDLQALVKENALLVTWKRPEDLGKVKGYKVIYQPLSGGEDTLVEKVVEDATCELLEVKEIDSAATSVYDVKVYTLYEDGAISEGIGVTTAIPSQTSQVYNLSATSTNSTIQLTWEKPTGEDLIGYLVSYSVPGGAVTDIKINEPDTTEANIQYLVAGREYCCEISALYEDHSSRKLILTQRTKPQLPTNIQVSSIKTESLTLKWERPTGDLSGYLVGYKPISVPMVTKGERGTEEGKGADEGDEGKDPKEEEKETREEKEEAEEKEVTEMKEMSVKADKEEVEIGGLIAGQVYLISLCTKSQEETGEVHTIEQSTKPEKVQDLTASVAQTSINVAWKPPAVGGCTGFVATCSSQSSTDTSSAITTKELPLEETSVMFDDLKENDVYEIEVFTISRNQKSDGCSQSVTMVCTKKLPQAKDACIISTRSSITVSWKKPDHDDLTGYEISCFHIEPPPILSTEQKATDKEIVITWSTPPLDFNGYKVVCYKVSAASQTDSKDDEGGEDGDKQETEETTKQKDDEAMNLAEKKKVAEKALGSEATEVAFDQLESDTMYFIEMFTVHGEIENEAAEVTIRTEKVAKPLQVVDLSWEADASSLTVSWKQPDMEVSGYLVNIVLPTNPSELVVDDPSSLDSDQTDSEGKDEGPREVEKEGGSKDTLPCERICRDGETGELVECMVKGEVLETRRLEANQTSTIFGSLQTKTVYAVHVASILGDQESDWVHFVGKTSPVDGLLPVVDLTATSTKESITLAWSPPDGIATGYRIKYTMSDVEKESESESKQEETEENTKPPAQEEEKNKEMSDDKDEENKDSTKHDNDDESKEKKSKEADQSDTEAAENINQSGDTNNAIDQAEKDTSEPSDLIDVGVEASSYQIDGLSPCQEYLIQVWTLNGDFLSDPAETKIKTIGDWTVQVLMHEDTPNEQSALLYLSIIGSSSSEENIILSKESDPLKIGEGSIQVLSKDIDDVHKIRLEATDVDLETFMGIHIKEVSMVRNTTMEELLFKGDVWLRRLSEKHDKTKEENSSDKDGGESKKDEKEEVGKEDDDSPKEETEVAEGKDKGVVEEGKETNPKEGEPSEANRKTKTEETDAAKEDRDDTKEDGHLSVKETSDTPSDANEVTAEETITENSDGKEKTDVEAIVEVMDDLIVELPLAGASTLSVLTYKVEVHTSSDEGSSSNANAYITIHGSRADTGKRDLWKSDKPVKFQLGQVDTFYLQAVDIDTIQRVTLGHDGISEESDWKVDKIILSLPSYTPGQMTFACDKWFSREKDDGLTERILEPSGLLTGDEEEGKKPTDGEAEPGKGEADDTTEGGRKDEEGRDGNAAGEAEKKDSKAGDGDKAQKEEPEKDKKDEDGKISSGDGGEEAKSDDKDAAKSADGKDEENSKAKEESKEEQDLMKDDDSEM
ncbi:uncharacterized protein [Apostichopus japonicus]|uniref:uncharacterized protein isoform X4 n=1 Tax=Stichopus japonicus TaxID=307972 RepID=UPI003AB4000C